MNGCKPYGNVVASRQPFTSKDKTEQHVKFSFKVLISVNLTIKIASLRLLNPVLSSLVKRKIEFHDGEGFFPKGMGVIYFGGPGIQQSKTC